MDLVIEMQLRFIETTNKMNINAVWRINLKIERTIQAEAEAVVQTNDALVFCVCGIPARGDVWFTIFPITLRVVLE